MFPDIFVWKKQRLCIILSVFTKKETVLNRYHENFMLWLNLLLDNTMRLSFGNCIQRLLWWYNLLIQQDGKSSIMAGDSRVGLIGEYRNKICSAV